MEGQIVKHTDTIRMKLPDLKKGLETVEFLKSQNSKEIKVDYMISNNLWAKAEVPVNDKVCLWLGADVLCEYTFEEARVVLNKNYEAALTALKNNEDDLDFLKDQITTCEVSKKILLIVDIARLHNENVKRKNIQQK
jgi:prefoldin subunit 5